MSRQHPALVSLAVVLRGRSRDMQILLTRRRRQEGGGSLGLPEKACVAGQHPLEAAMLACRGLLKREPGEVNPVWLSLRCRPDRDPEGWVAAQPFLFAFDGQPDLSDWGQDNATWVDLDRAPALALDHGAILCEALGRFWQEMPGHHPSLSGRIPFGRWQKRTLSGTITFYGGTFHPWHQGHLACVELFPRKEQLMIVLDRDPKKPLQDFPCFFEVYRNLLEKMKGTGVHVFPGFFGQESSNPTVFWLPHTSFERKGLLLGADSFVGLRHWVRASELAKCLHQVLVVPRMESAQALREASEWLANQNPACLIRELESHPYRALSSTAIRRKPQEGTCRP